MRQLWYSIALLGLAACGDPIADIPRLSEQDLPENTPTAEALAAQEAQDGGLIQQLMKSEADVVAAVDAETPENAKPASRGGFLAILTGQPSKEEVVKVALADPQAMTSQKASVSATPSEETETQSRGLFGMAAVKGADSAASEVAPGTKLPFGKVARVCGMTNAQMGKKIAQYPEKRPRHKIYDSDPGNIAPHSFFITGFDDRCVRQFTASLAVFGSVAMHEQLRYGLPAEVQPYSDTDKAYETVKSRVCGVPRRKPCGNKVKKLDSSTVFISIYERFGSNSHWANLLLHNGQVLAQDRKGG